ncbi:cell division protein FtsQ/DivIB [Humisphaera borealis]|uniref:FtsQ-type POTRA domain-containing protein n=1 Tax=Humisphaera borealis TaxID=2807512 RepID=A0A7M2WU04_9BACT|nr:hypothetical protein [Humisphaera borealis]QOV89005.1 hypothetical protein IPV69_22700 [Humisphaera borealis]
MAKAANRRGREAPPIRPETDAELARRRFIRRATINTTFAILFVGGFAWLVGNLRQTIADRSVATLPTIAFVSRPAWMTDLVAHNLCESFRPGKASSVFDRNALVDVNARLKANPWVSKVRSVRRTFRESAGDTIEVDCDFRTPVALVYDNDSRYWFVDEKGIKLPEWFDADQLGQLLFANGRVNLRIIEGIRNPAPVVAGKQWAGDDLQAGIDLARLLHGLPFAEEVLRINVSNYGGRLDQREAQIVLMTRHGSEIRWGTAIKRSDRIVEVTVERKLEVMKQIVAKFGRIDAGQPWIDIRFETVTYPAQPATQEGAHADGGR